MVKEIDFDFIACDLETTGLDPINDQIIEIALVKVQNKQITDTLNTLINPQCQLPLKIKRLTGITDQKLASAPLLQDTLPEIERFLTALPLLGHNISFDRSFLTAKIGPLPFSYCIDTLELARLIMPDAPSHSLVNLVQNLSLKQTPSHRALGDVLAAVDLYEALINKAASLNLNVLLQMLPFLRQSGSTLTPIVENIVKNKTRQALVNQSHQNYRGIPIKNPASASGQISMESKAGVLATDLKEDDPQYALSYLLGQDSPLAQLLPNFCARKEQIKMARAVEEAIETQTKLLVEAGTGTGKSIAYLLPLLLRTLRKQSRAIIATNTINLQEQIWLKDIPLLKKLLQPFAFNSTLLKGRSNYLCLRKITGFATGTATLTPEEAFLGARLIVWLQQTDDGDKAELNLFGVEAETWSQICSEHESCLGNACPWSNRFCFVNRARRKAENAHLVIVNHSLLFSDLGVEKSILPEYETLVIDEAHNIEETAGNHLGSAVSYNRLIYWLNQVSRTMKKLRELSPPQEGERWIKAIGQAEENKQKLQEKINIFFNLFVQAIHNNHQQPGNYRIQTRIFHDQGVLKELEAECSNLLFDMRNYIDQLKNIAQWLEIWSVTNKTWEDRLLDTTMHINSGSILYTDLEFILKSPTENYVCWVETPPMGTQFKERIHCILHATPIDVSTILYEQLFSKPQTIVLTSATLTVNRKFNHFIQTCGLDKLSDDELSVLIAESPFDYDTQCLLCVASDLPGFGQTRTDNYLNSLTSTIYTLSVAANGKTLVLFTAHKLLRDTYFKIKPLLNEADICVLGQNIDGGRTRLINEFRQNNRSVLFGALSFWEGVDLPGDSLVNVIIVKLPFAPPNDPVIAARSEKLVEQGLNSFYNLSLPNAVIRFKQGFGRLIRSENDKGAVVILDKRIIEKRYGQFFFGSLPIQYHIQCSTEDIREKLTAWLS